MSWTNAEKDAWVMETIEYLVMMTLSRLNKGDMESEEDPLHHGAAQQEEPHADGGDHPDSVTSHVKPTCNVCGKEKPSSNSTNTNSATKHRTNPIKVSSARAARTTARLNAQQNAISVNRFCQKRRIAQECGTTVMTVRSELCARTAAGLGARQSIAKRVRHAEIPHARKPQKEVIALML